MCGLVFMCVVFAQEPKENLLGLTLKFHKLLIDYKVGQFPHTNSNIYRRTSFDDVVRVRPRNSPVCTRTAQRSGRCGELSLLITPLVISRTWGKQLLTPPYTHLTLHSGGDGRGAQKMGGWDVCVCVCRGGWGRVRGICSVKLNSSGTTANSLFLTRSPSPRLPPLSYPFYFQFLPNLKLGLTAIKFVAQARRASNVPFSYR